MIAILRGAVFALRTAVQDVSRRPLFSLLSIAAMGAAGAAKAPLHGGKARASAQAIRVSGFIGGSPWHERLR